MKKLMMTIAIAMSLMSTAFAANISDVGVNVKTQETFNKLASLNTVVNWDKGADSDIVVMGFGYSDKNKLMARRAAIVDGYRNLAETVGGVNVDANTTVESMMVANDTVRTSINAVVKGSKIIEEGELSDGNYYVKMSLPLFGNNSLAAATIPNAGNITTAEKVSKRSSVLTKEDFKEAKSAKYTGVIVDCKNMDLECTFAPIIYDTEKRAVYGLNNINRDFAISKGMVEYATEINQFTRAGNNPLIVKAITVSSGVNSVNKVNAVISPADADRLLLANELNYILDDCKVVFVR